MYCISYSCNFNLKHNFKFVYFFEIHEKKSVVGYISKCNFEKG